MKRVLVIGSVGQDGRLLVDKLMAEGAGVVGISRRGTSVVGMPTSGLPTAVDIRDPAQVRGIVEAYRPDEAYYLAAYHHSAEDGESSMSSLAHRSYEVHVSGVINLLDAIRTSAPRCHLFYAASSHVFGFPSTRVQSESTPSEPRCVYGITKTAGVHACRFYREHHGVFAAVGILYNHESPLRGRGFVSQRIAHGAVEALAATREGRSCTLAIGHLSAIADWGYAPDYVDAMTRITRYDVPSDFVVATGVEHTVRDFVEAAFRCVGLDWARHVEERPDIVRKPHRVLIGDSSKLRSATGWSPTVSFEEMVRRLVEAASQAKR